MRARRGITALAVVVVLSMLGACGSGSVTSAAREQLAAVTTTTETVTQPAKTVTAPARTETVTRTETTTVPGNTTTIHSKTTTVQASPTGKQSSSGIPAWAWVLIGAGAVLLAVAIFMLGHARGARRPDAGVPGGPAGRPPDSTMPPRGPPRDPI